MAWKPSLFAFLTFMIATVALCGVLVYLATMSVFGRTESLRAEAEAERLDGIMISAVRSVLREPEVSLEMTAALLESMSGNEETILAVAQRQSRYFRSLMILDRDGVVSAVAPPSAIYAGADYSNAEFLSRVSSSSTTSWSTIHAGLDEGSREISLGMAIDGGAILAILDFDTMASRLAALLGSSASGLSLADSSGTYIVHRDKSKIDRRETDAGLLSCRLADPGAGTYRFMRGSGKDATFVLARRIPEVDWFVIVDRPADFAMEAFKSTLLPVSVMAALAIGLAAALAVVATRRLMLDVQAAGHEAEHPERGLRLGAMYFKETIAIRDATRAAAERMRTKDADNVRLKQALDELARAQKALVESERLAVQGAMAATMAHEFNTPIAAVDSAAVTTERLARDILSHAGRSTVAAIASAARSLAELCDAYDPAVAPTGTSRRNLVRAMESLLRSRLAATECGGAGRIDPGTLASRLVDLGLTHEQRERVASIIDGLCADDLGATLSALSAAEIAASCRVTRSAMAKAHGVVSSIRGYASPESDERFRPIRIKASVDEALALLYVQTKRDVRLELIAEDDPWVDVQPATLQRIWMNMIANALDAIGYRGYLGIRIFSKNGRAMIEFEDSGPAIPEVLLRTLWQQNAASRLQGERGGINLAPVKELVGLAGGEILCRSSSGCTVFAISLPEHGSSGPVERKNDNAC